MLKMRLRKKRVSKWQYLKSILWFELEPKATHIITKFILLAIFYNIKVKLGRTSYIKWV